MNRTPYIAPDQRDGYNAPTIDVNAGTAAPEAAAEPEPKAAPVVKKPAAKAPAKRKTAAK